MAVKILGALDVTGSMGITVSDVPGLPAGQITSGTLSASRIPNLAASKITSGTLNVARIPDDLRGGQSLIGKDSSNYIAIDHSNSNYIVFVLGGVQVARIDSSGNLEVKGDVTAVDSW